MKVKDIKMGHRYTNGKGWRLVIADGDLRDEHEKRSYIDSDSDSDLVRYRVTARNKDQPIRLGSEHRCTRAAFARWAKTEVP